MKRVLKIIIIALIFIPFITVSALEENSFDEKYMEINPEWEYYMQLPDDEKANYTAIPEQYIYKYIEKKQTMYDYFSNFFSMAPSLESDTLPSNFDLSNVDGKNYVNGITKNQGSLGLCWVFGSIGTAESNILLNGVKGLEQEAKKCDLNNPTNTKACRLYSDNKNNSEYINGEVSRNSDFAEANIDYICTRGTNAKVYNKKDTYIDAYTEGYNLYGNESNIGDGGNFSTVAKYYSYGITPIRAINDWSTYNSTLITRSLSQVYDNVDNDYQVTEYINLPSKPSASDSFETWKKIIKQKIMDSGSIYVSTVAPQQSSSGSCYYYGQKEVNGTLKNISLINYDGNSSNCHATSFGLHAMQVIGWDDDFTYNYCRASSWTNGDNYNETTCTAAGYTWISGKGIWILKNSWGKTSTYPYLTYTSSYSELSQVREVSVANFDNSYNKVNSTYTYTKGVQTIDGLEQNVYEQKFYKGSKNEYLTRVNFTLSSSNANVDVYVSKDGENYDFIETKYIDYTGLYTSDINNIKLDKETYYIRLVSNSSITVASINGFTVNECTYQDNCDDLPETNTAIDKNAFLKTNKELNITTKSRNIPSGSKLEYRLIDDSNKDITDKVTITNNYVVENSNVAKMVFNEELPIGKYHILTNYGDSTSTTDFTVDEEIFIEFNNDKPIFLSDGKATIKYKFSNEAGITDPTWKISDEKIATIDGKGEVTLISSGYTTVELKAKTHYGEVSKIYDLFVYDKIYTIEDFFTMQLSENSSKAYYLMNDLDFKGVDFSNYTNIVTNFGGILNGGFHTIKNVTKTGTTSVGLFNKLSSAIISNLKITNSTFTGTTYTGSITGMSNGSKITGIMSDATVNGQYYSGGIVGYAFNDEYDQCVNTGKVTSSSTKTYAVAGGIIGAAYSIKLENTINKGIITAESNWVRTISTYSYASGIVGKAENAISIKNSVNIGTVKSTSTVSNAINSTNGLVNDETTATDSYYLTDTNYDTLSTNAKSETELTKKLTYNNWDFENVWEIREEMDYPNLQIFGVNAEKLTFEIETTNLNTNQSYNFTYTVEPDNYAGEVTITSSDENLFTIENNKILTKSKEGTGKIIFNAKGKIFEYEISIKNKINITYDKEYTNQDLNVNIEVNYDPNDSTGYLKLNYFDGTNKTETFAKGSTKGNKTITISENGTINVGLYFCNISCTLIDTKNIEITNIDKKAPTLQYETDVNNNTLKLTVTDDISGLKSDSDYSFAISNTNMIQPTTFMKYQNGIIMNNITMSYINKYLWIKSLSDNAGNKMCDSIYCNYDMNIAKKKYKVYYYDETGENLIDTENYEEDTKLYINKTITKESDEYYDYDFDYWSGYTKGMTITKDITLVAVFKKIEKQLKSDEFIIDENGYIKNIKVSNIKDKYSTTLFKEKLNNNKYYHFYDNNILSDNLEYIKTGLVYKYNDKAYKIVLAGDVTGDGIIQINDIIKMATHIIKNNVLEDEYYVAGDVTGDNNVQINDVMKLANLLVNGGGLK